MSTKYMKSRHLRNLLAVCCSCVLCVVCERALGMREGETRREVQS